MNKGQPQRLDYGVVQPRRRQWWEIRRWMLVSFLLFGIGGVIIDHWETRPRSNPGPAATQPSTAP
jgi:hypothetical protein